MSTRYRIEILDAITDPGTLTRPNEDSFGHNADSAFVVDGATGLGDWQFMPGHGSDAAWIAAFSALRLRENLTGTCDVRTVIREICRQAADEFRSIAGDQPRYAWPLSALAAARATPHGFEFIGLGDCCLYLLPDTGEAEIHMAIPDAFQREQAAAREHIHRVGGIGPSGAANDDPTTLAGLRRHRERQNTDDGDVWTLGLVPETADHLTIHPLPLKSSATAIVCSDGLADLVSLYHTRDAAGLVKAARTSGLASLVEELRHFERVVDPDGHRFPRFKQSDDTTAILLRLTVD